MINYYIVHTVYIYYIKHIILHVHIFNLPLTPNSYFFVIVFLLFLLPVFFLLHSLCFSSSFYILLLLPPILFSSSSSFHIPLLPPILFLLRLPFISFWFLHFFFLLPLMTDTFEDWNLCFIIFIFVMKLIKTKKWRHIFFSFSKLNYVIIKENQMESTPINTCNVN